MDPEPRFLWERFSNHKAQQDFLQSGITRSHMTEMDLHQAQTLWLTQSRLDPQSLRSLLIRELRSLALVID